MRTRSARFLNRNRRDILDIHAVQTAFTVTLILSMCLCSGEVAQAASTDNSTDIQTLSEVIITARRQAEPLQTVPIAITALSGNELASQRIETASDLLPSVPGSTFTSFSMTENLFSVRGISSQTAGASGESAVAVAFDDVVISRDFMKSFELFDLNRIEVLRGPQGTSFGRNASAGLMNVITNTPIFEDTAYVQTTLGDYNLRESNAVLNTALSSTVAARASLHVSDRDGYTTNLYTGRDEDFAHNLSFRGQILANVSDALEILTRAEYSRDNDGAPPRKAKDCRAPFLEPPFGNYTEISCNPWQVYYTAPDHLFQTRSIWSVSTEVRWTPGDDLRLTSITAYRKGKSDTVQNSFGTNIDVVITPSTNNAYQVSEEVRLDNYSANKALGWLTGIYLLHDDASRFDDREVLFGTPLATTDPAGNKNKTDSLGLFGSTDWKLTDTVNLSIGGRYSYDKKRYSADHAPAGPLADIFADPGQSPVIADTSNSWRNFSGKVSINYIPYEGLMTYALVSQGYKSGGFNEAPPSYEAALTPYGEEKATNYEVGIKSDWLDRRLRLDLALFDLQYKGLQVSTFAPSGTAIIGNAGSAKVLGAELEATARPLENLTVTASYARYNARLHDYILLDQDLSGNRPDNSPTWTSTATVDYAIPLQSGRRIAFEADFRERSDVFSTPNNDPSDVRPGVPIVGARGIFVAAGGNWETSLWVRNVSNKAEIVYVTPSAIVSQHPVAYGPPRTFGITSSYRFR
jgi:iron complex outermembrane receptor protein